MNRTRLLTSVATVALAASFLPLAANAEPANRIEGKVTSLSADHRSPAWTITVDGQQYGADRSDVKDPQLGDDVYLKFVASAHGPRATYVRLVNEPDLAE